MKNFILRLTLFSLPIFAYCFITFFILYFSGELISLDRIIEIQSSDIPVLFGRAYTNDGFYYKLLSCKKRKPEIIALGSSRVLQIKKKFFKNNIKFYNCGGSISNPFEANEFIKILESDERPKLIIFGMDVWWFNYNIFKDYDVKKEKIFFSTTKLKEDNLFEKFYRGSRKLLFDFKKIAPFLKKLKKKEPYMGNLAFGINSIINGNGYRNDGSYRYGNKIIERSKNNVSVRFADIFNRIKIGKSGFEYGDTLYEHNLKEIDYFLNMCKKFNIKVVGFLPPFANVIYDTMIKSGKYTYIEKLIPRLEEIFEKYNYNFYNFPDLNSIGLDDIEAYDGFHGNELVYLKIYFKMMEKTKYLNDFSDKDIIESKIEAGFDFEEW